MKTLISLLLATLMICCGITKVSDVKDGINNMEERKTNPIAIERSIGDLKAQIMTISKKTADRFYEREADWESKNETYNDYDVEKLRAFLEIEDSNGVKNGDKIARYDGSDYDPDDPASWSCIGWTSEGDLDHILYSSINFAEYDEDGYPVSADDLLVGILDVSGMNSLVYVNIPCNLIDGIIADDCPSLEEIYCGTNVMWYTQCSIISAKRCPSLYYIGADCCMQSSVDIEGSTGIEELFMWGTPNLTDIDLEDCRETIGALEFSESGLTSVDLSNMSNLWAAHFDECPLESILLENNDSYFELSIESTRVEQLDLSDCINLEALFIGYTSIEELDLSACINLQQLFCQQTAIRVLDATNCEQLWLANADYEGFQLETALFSLYGNKFSVTAENGTIGVLIAINYMDPEYIAVYSVPRLSVSSFEGWWDAGNETLVSEDLEFFFDESMMDRMQNEDIHLVARFSGGDEPLFGDVNGDGAVTAEDALLVMRCALELIDLTPEQLELADINGDCFVNLVDALLILRTAMGLN